MRKVKTIIWLLVVGLFAGFAIILTVIYRKTLIVTIPAFALCVYLYEPKVSVLHIILLCFWVIFVVSNARVSAFSYKEIKPPLWYALLEGIIGVVILLLLIFRSQIQINFVLNKAQYDDLVGYSGLLLIAMILLWQFLIYVICPMFVLEKIKIETELEDYFRVYSHKNQQNYICFKNDLDSYNADFVLFRKFKGMVGVRFSYVKCRCILGVCYIRSVKKCTDKQGDLSAWDRSAYAQRQRKMLKILIIATVGVVSLGAIIIFIMANWVI